MQYKVNISIDDVSPHPMSSVKVLNRCYELIDVFPDIKFTLFVPLAYWRQSGATRTEHPLEIQLFPEFCAVIKNLPDDNFEIGYHGLWHGVPPYNNNDEFKDVDYEAADLKIKSMFKVAQLAGLEHKFKPIFRPPAWRLSPEGFRACADNGIRVFAISSKDYLQEVYAGHDKQYDCVYYNCNPPFDPLEMYEKTEIVYHACEWDRNYLDQEKTKELINFLQNNKERVMFSYMTGML